MERSGSGFVSMTNGFGSGRPLNLQGPNTAINIHFYIYSILFLLFFTVKPSLNYSFTPLIAPLKKIKERYWAHLLCFFSFKRVPVAVLRDCITTVRLWLHAPPLVTHTQLTSVPKTLPPPPPLMYSIHTQAR
jgi:hypothetical protein